MFLEPGARPLRLNGTGNSSLDHCQGERIMNTRRVVTCATLALAAAIQAMPQSGLASPPKRALPVLSAKPAAPQVKTIEPQRKPGAGIARAGDPKLLGTPLQADLLIAAYYGDGGLPEGFPGTGYCDPNPAGGASHKVRLRVKNQGAVQAAASVLRVDFASGGSVFLNVPALAPDAETSGAVVIPAGCYPPGFSTNCQFNITVDANAQVSESSEFNNHAMSYCVAPAG
jgi:hypothetical protein